jgi:hypothetical protein
VSPPSASPKPPGGTPPKGKVVVRGVVQAGVEPGCTMLVTGGVEYQLIGGNRAVLRSGARVEVVGVVNSSQATTCMQGLPLLVQRATAI